jgi:hypothetical protein
MDKRLVGLFFNLSSGLIHAWSKYTIAHGRIWGRAKRATIVRILLLKIPKLLSGPQNSIFTFIPIRKLQSKLMLVWNLSSNRSQTLQPFLILNLLWKTQKLSSPKQLKHRPSQFSPFSPQIHHIFLLLYRSLFHSLRTIKY